MTVRRLGLEEELLLGDMVSGELRPVAREIIEASRQGFTGKPGAEVKHEFFLSQVEVASRPHTDLGEVRTELTEAR